MGAQRAYRQFLEKEKERDIGRRYPRINTWPFTLTFSSEETQRKRLIFATEKGKKKKEPKKQKKKYQIASTNEGEDEKSFVKDLGSGEVKKVRPSGGHAGKKKKNKESQESQMGSRRKQPIYRVERDAE